MTACNWMVIHYIYQSADNISILLSQILSDIHSLDNQSHNFFFFVKLITY